MAQKEKAPRTPNQQPSLSLPDNAVTTRTALPATGSGCISLHENMLEGFAHCRMLYDQHGQPVDFVYLEVNAAFSRLTGLTDIVGKRVSEAFPGIRESYPRIFEVYGRVATTGRPEKFEIDFAPLAICLSISAYSDQKDHFCAVFEDITQRRRAEAELEQYRRNLEVKVREKTEELETANARLRAEIAERRLAEQGLRDSEEKFRSIFENSLEGIIFAAPEGQVFAANPAACEMLGWSEQEIIAGGRDRITDMADPRMQQAIQQPLHTGRFRGEINHRRKSGILFPTEISKSLFTLANGDVRTVISLRDITERKRIEKQYRDLFDSSKDGIARVDMQGRIQEVNTAGIELLGYSEEEFRQLTCWQVTPQKWQEMEAGIVRAQVLPRGYSDEYEKEYVRKDGSIVPVTLRVWLSRDEQGNPSGMWAIIRDITERRRTETALKEKEELYRLLINNLNDGFFVIDAQGFLTFGNNSLAQMYGFETPDEMLGKHILDLVAPAAKDAIWRLFSRAVTRGRILASIEIPTLRKDGEVVLAEVKPTVFSHKDGKVVIQGLLIDITQRKKAEEALRISEERLALAMKATQDAVWDWDLLANTIYYSPRWWDIVGYRKNELEASPGLWRSLMHPEDAERADRIFNEALTGTETSFEVEGRLLHKDGHYVPILARGFILRDDHDRPVRGAGTITDLTEHKKIEEERRLWERQRQRLYKAESLNRMAGAVAHHFNNLLGVVLGNLELFLCEQPRAEANDVIVEAMNASRQAAEVGGLMLTYLGQSTARQQPLDLAEACRGALPRLRSGIGQNVNLTTDLPSPGPTVVANADQLQQVLSNLIVNASEAIGSGQGSIRLAVGPVAPADIPATNRFPIDWQPPDKAYVCLEVQDNGSGMTDKDIEQIFDPFYSTKFTGRGLGLPVALGIVRAHQGGITVQSEPARGSVFRVFLPLAAEFAPARTDEVSRVSQPGRGRTVLLVENEEMVRSITEKMLQHLGFTVLTAKDGPETVGIFRQNRDQIHCVLLSLPIPFLDGRELLRSIHEIDPDVPVLIASFFDEAKKLRWDQAKEPRAFLAKPYQMNALKETLGKVMQEFANLQNRSGEE